MWFFILKSTRVYNYNIIIIINGAGNFPDSVLVSYKPEPCNPRSPSHKRTWCSICNKSQCHTALFPLPVLSEFLPSQLWFWMTMISSYLVAHDTTASSITRGLFCLSLTSTRSGANHWPTCHNSWGWCSESAIKFMPLGRVMWSL